MSKSSPDREKRLAKALRDNLRRRKAGARGEASVKPAERDRDPEEHAEKPEHHG